METKQSNNSATPMADAVKIAGINQRALFNLEWENDTVFKKRELNYKTKSAFQKDLEAGKISKYTTVFIKDTKEIYKNGQYYGSKLDNFNIANENLSNLFVYLIKKVTEDELSTIDELIKDLPYKKIGEDKIFNGKVCISSEESSTIDASVLIKYIDRDNFRIEWNSSAYNVAIYSIFGWLQYVLQVSGGKISINKFDSIGFTPSVSSKNISIVSYDMFNTKEGISVTLTKSGNGTKYLSNDGTYKEIKSISDAPDENLYVRKKNEWARINIPEVQSDIVFIDIDFMSYSYPSDGNSIDLTLEQYNKISEAIDKKKIFRINAICGTFFGYANLKPVSEQGEQQEENPIKYQILISSLDSYSIPGSTDINKYENLLLSITEYNGEYKATFTSCKDKVIITDGNGSLFLSNDGTYKTVIDSKLSRYSKVNYDGITENDTIKDAIGKLEYKINDITNYITISSNILYLGESSTKEDILEALKPNIHSLQDFWYRIKNNEKIRIDPGSSGRYSDLLLSIYKVIGSAGYNVITITGMFIDNTNTTFDTFLATLKIKFKDEELLKLEFSKL